MQNRAPGYISADTKEELQARRIPVLSQPVYSPDLNPIEIYWNQMKDYIEDHWGLEENPSYNKLRRYVQEAWEALPESFLEELINSMQARCQAVIEANGIHTKY